jgi:hypothetical protein
MYRNLLRPRLEKAGGITLQVFFDNNDNNKIDFKASFAGTA